MIYVRNLRDYSNGNNMPSGENHVRCDRKSVLGNPFYMDNESKRNLVCDQYQRYFDKKVQDKDPIFINELRRLYKIAVVQDLYLYCWCAPKRCHCETIKRFLESFIN